MTDGDAQGQYDGAPPVAPGRRRRARIVVEVVFVAAVVVAAAITLVDERHAFGNSLRRVGVWAFATSLACGLVALLGNLGSWRAVLRGLGVSPSWRTAARTFYVSQLGKYLPGSVWPAVMQAEAGRSWGTTRTTMLAANFVSLILSITVGLLMACLLLPLHGSSALRHYWWAFIAVPFLLATLHPRTVPALVDRALKLLHRDGRGARIDGKAELQAAAWSAFSWVALGLHLTVLCDALGHGGFSVALLCIGAVALAVPVGVLVIPAPAGAGIREVVLGFVLTLILTHGQVLAVVVASRVILAAADGLAALAAVGLVRGRPVMAGARRPAE